MAEERAEAFFDKVKTKGRPKLVLNAKGIDAIVKMAEIMCTDEEIASVLGTTVATLQNADNKDTFLECKQKGNANGKKSLRRTQFDIAKNGNATMAIWLGKQYLGQKESEDKKDDGKEPKTVKICFVEPEEGDTSD